MIENQNNVPKWLKSLQENSWELELLISGGAIFTLFQVSESWINWISSISMVGELPGRTFFLIIGTLGIEILKLGFILHLLLRTFWLAMVCINYVFPNGIVKSKLNWKKPYDLKIEDGEALQKEIVFVDRLCGIIIYLSITSTFLFAGINLAIFILQSFPMMLGFESTIFTSVIVISFVVYIFDVITNGLLRKTPYLSYLTFPFFKIYDYVTLRRFYQKANLLFSSNINRLKFSLSALLFLIIAITFSYLNIYRIMYWPNIFDQREYVDQMADSKLEINYRFYKDEIPEGQLPQPHIQSRIVKGNYLELYIPYRKYFDMYLKLIDKKGDSFISDLFIIKIDSTELTDIEWIPTYNHSTLNNNKGITAMIPIGHLENKRHVLHLETADKLYKLVQQDEGHSMLYERFLVPFWKDSND